jgi:hypothetical protein
MTAVDYEGTGKRSYIQDPHGGYYNLMATFPSPDEAGRAMQELRRRGFPSEHVHVMGTSEDAIDAAIGLPEEDKRVTTATIRYGMLGMVAGAVLGAVVGVILMAIPAFQSAIDVHPGAGAYLLAAAFGAIVGSMMGFAGGIWGMDSRRSGSRTYRGRRPVALPSSGYTSRTTSGSGWPPADSVPAARRTSNGSTRAGRSRSSVRQGKLGTHLAGAGRRPSCYPRRLSTAMTARQPPMITLPVAPMMFQRIPCQWL